MEKYVLKHISRPTASTIESFEKLDVSTVYEAQGKRGLLDHRLQPILPNTCIAGPAVTVTCPAGDNLMIHASIEVCQPGDVLVVSTLGNVDAGMVGELIVTALMKRGVRGLVIDSGIRDVRQIRSMGFPVWVKAILSRGTTKNRGGWVNAPTVCGGIQIDPGDMILADDDGVVVVKQPDIPATLSAAEMRQRKEKTTKQKIDAGELSVDFYQLRPVLESEGVAYYNDASQLPSTSKR